MILCLRNQTEGHQGLDGIPFVIPPYSEVANPPKSRVLFGPVRPATDEASVEFPPESPTHQWMSLTAAEPAMREPSAHDGRHAQPRQRRAAADRRRPGHGQVCDFTDGADLLTSFTGPEMDS